MPLPFQRDALVPVLLCLEIRSLLECRFVCKWWSELIRSGWFRKLWSERHRHQQGSVLLSFAKDLSFGERLGVRRWLPPPPGSSQGTVSPYLEIRVPGFEHISRFDIVASSNGLVCACLDYPGCRYAVGNPVTGEWVHLLPPQPPVFRQPDRLTQYTLQAHSSGEFELQVVDESRAADYVMVYSSVSQSWSFSRAILPVSETLMHDIELGWVCVKPPVKLKNEVLGSDGTGDSLSFVTSWEFQGQTYLAGYTQNYDARPLEHLVWRASRLEKQQQSKGGVSWLLWDTGAKEQQVVREEFVERDDGDDAFFAYHGEGKLCAYAHFLAINAQPPGVYDVSSNTWYHLPEFGIQQADGPISDFPAQVVCTRAVVYHPSLIKPDQGGESQGMKRKRSHAQTTFSPKQRAISV